LLLLNIRFFIEYMANNFDAFPLPGKQGRPRSAPPPPPPPPPGSAAATLASKTLAVVEQLTQAALSARNSFVAEVNNAKAQQREVHVAAQARLEAELAKIAEGAASLSDRLFFGSKLAAKTQKVVTPVAPSRSPTPQPPQPSRPHTPAVAHATEEADLEVAAVSARAAVAELQEELAQLRLEKQAERHAQRAEFEALVEQRAEQRAAAEVASLRAQLADATGERGSLLAELDRISAEQEYLQERLHEAQVARGDMRTNADGYDLDSVSVVPGAPMVAEEAGGYATAVHRLEERVLALSRQLAAERTVREQMEASLRDKGISVPHLQLATSGVSPGLLRTVRRTTLPPLPPDAPMKLVRSTLALVEARCAEAEEGHATSTAALENMLRIVRTASGSERSDMGAVMAALPALASLSASGAAARALLSVGAAAVVGESMLVHASSPGVLCEGCATLCVLAGGLLSPLGLAPGAARLEARRRDAMCVQTAAQAGHALVRVGTRQASSAWVMLAVARTLGVLARSPSAAQTLLSAGAVQLLSRALATFAPDPSEYETANMAALALMALVAGSPELAEGVDRAGGRFALQQAAMASASLGRALAMEYPLQTPWLHGDALRTRRTAALLACFSAPGQALAPPAEELWLEAVRAAAGRAKSPLAVGGNKAGGSTAGSPAKLQAALAGAGRRDHYATSLGSADEEGDEDEEDFVGQL